ncbi:hypothetical protein B0H19DRAFT_1232061 [Mycena capillaripes]|nr:hypothetical protein B0H19DRAFT_1232061 [Mycena capillaripes]
MPKDLVRVSRWQLLRRANIECKMRDEERVEKEYKIRMHRGELFGLSVQLARESESTSEASRTSTEPHARDEEKRNAGTFVQAQSRRQSNDRTNASGMNKDRHTGLTIVRSQTLGASDRAERAVWLAWEGPSASARLAAAAGSAWVACRNSVGLGGKEMKGGELRSDIVRQHKHNED